MKKALILTAALSVLLSFVSCGGKTDSTAQQPSDAASQAADSDTPPGFDAKPAGSSEKTVCGVLYSLNLANGTLPLITGVSLSGNRCGESQEGGINGRKTATDHIRSIFMLNEWISVNLETEMDEGFSACILPHSEDFTVYQDGYFNSLPDAAPFAELMKPAESDLEWGALCMNPDDWKPGDYDLVIAYGSTPVSVVQLKIYADTELENKSNDELAALMDDLMNGNQ